MKKSNIMSNIVYRVNGSLTTQSLAEWFFGSQFVANLTAYAKLTNEATGENTFKFWQGGTGYLTIEIR
jgi:hypothetical protein